MHAWFRDGVDVYACMQIPNWTEVGREECNWGLHITALGVGPLCIHVWFRDGVDLYACMQIPNRTGRQRGLSWSLHYICDRLPRNESLVTKL